MDDLIWKVFFMLTVVHGVNVSLFEKLLVHLIELTIQLSSHKSPGLQFIYSVQENILL